MNLKFGTMKINLLILFFLVVIVGLAIYVRFSTISATTILDYDPWWYFRHTQEILNNNLIPPKWDILSYYPPGRPFPKQLGWEYTIIFFYKIAEILKPGITLFQLSQWAPLIMVSLGAISAYFIGSSLTNKWGGLITALFAVLAPTFISVSMATYLDSKPPVVFYMYTCVLTMILALRQKSDKLFSMKSLPYIALAIVSNSLFVWTWGGGWLVLLLFLAFIPALFIFRIIEELIHKKSFKIALPVRETIRYAIPIVIVIIFTNIFALFTGVDDIVTSVSTLLGFVNPAQGLLVNISVAELQPVNIFTSQGFSDVASRVGLVAFFLSMVGLPILVIYKLWKKTSINFFEIFMFLWLIATFYMILHGVRFALLFSTAAAVAAGYVIGNAVQLFKKDVIGVSFFGIIFVLIMMFVSDAMAIGSQSGAGFQIDSNWVNALAWLKQNSDSNTLIATWWDPGHIITGMTGLKVQADGAHCGPLECFPYNHNIRIQDMGRIFSTANENESAALLQKYTSLTPAQCQEAKNVYGSAVPSDACNPITQVYLIASSDLVGKYHWMSYFGDCLRQFGLNNSASCYNLDSNWFIQNAQAKDYIQVPLEGYDQQNQILSYLNGQITLVRQNGTWVPVYNNQVPIKEIVYYENNTMQHRITNSTNAIDGLIWVQSDFQVITFMQPDVRDSMLTKLFFFNGEGLNHFKLVYSNDELKIFKVVF